MRQTVDSNETNSINGKNYTGGLFKYTAGLDALKQNKQTNVWTENPLFSKVVIDKEADRVDFEAEGDDTGQPGQIIVQSFLHQKIDASNKAEISENELDDFARAKFNLTKQ